MKAAIRRYRFNNLELDLVRYELRRSGTNLHLPRIPMELLILLVKRRGTLITREEIIRHLWSEPNSIDVVQGVNAAIKRVRAILNDDPAHPRFIETVVGKGYRFIAKVEEVADDATVDLSANELSRPICAESQQSSSETAIEGLESHLYTDTLSGTRQAEGHLSVVRWLQLTALAAAILLAGLTVIKLRVRNEREDVPGPLIQITSNDGDNMVLTSAIRPDGRMLAYADASGIYVRSLSGGARSLLAPQHFSSRNMYWFPDNARMLVSGEVTDSSKSQIWTLFPNGSPPSLVADHARIGVPSLDGKRIAFTNDAGTEILIANPDGSHVMSVLTGSNDTFPLLAWSPDGKLEYERRHFQVSDLEPNLYTAEFEQNYSFFYEVMDLSSRRIVATTQDFRMDSVCPPRDNKILFITKQKSGSHSLEDVAVDPRTGRLRPPAHFIRDLNTSSASSLSCSSDGKIATAVLWRGQPDVYVADISSQRSRLTNIHRLTLSSFQDFPQAWTPDSKSVIFESDRSGTFGIFKQSLDQKLAEMIVDTPLQEVLPQVTPDGRWILYASIAGDAPAGTRQLMRVPIEGGKPELVPIGGTLDEFRCSHSIVGDCVLRQTRNNQEFVYFRLDPLTGKGEELARRKWEPNVLGDWDVSPDGQALAISFHNPADPRILILPLRTSGTAIRTKEISFQGMGGTLWSSMWAADGKGLYLTFKQKASADLIYTDLQGQTCLIRTMGVVMLPVPSPDSKHIAFWDATPDQNVWLVK